MLSIQARKPLNRWDHSSIRPGPVGSIGDVNLQPRLKQSAPDFPFKFDPEFSHNRESIHGSNVTDGQHTNYNSHGGPSTLIDTNWGGRRDFSTQRGWVFQDLRPEDRSIEPLLGELPQYSWRNRVATNYNAVRTGDKFLPLPHGYSLGPDDIARGGAYPVVTDIAGGNLAPQEFDYQGGDNAPIDVNTFGARDPTTNPTNVGTAGYSTAKPKSGPSGLKINGQAPSRNRL